MKTIFQIHGPLEIPKSANSVYLKDRQGLFETMGFSHRNLSSDDESLTFQFSPALDNTLAKMTTYRKKQEETASYKPFSSHI